MKLYRLVFSWYIKVMNEPNFYVFIRNFTNIFWKINTWKELQGWFNFVERDKKLWKRIVLDSILK